MSIEHLKDVVHIYANLPDVSDTKSFQAGSVVGSNESIEQVIDKEIKVVESLTGDYLSIFKGVDEASDSPDAQDSFFEDLATCQPIKITLPSSRTCQWRSSLFLSFSHTSDRQSMLTINLPDDFNHNFLIKNPSLHILLFTGLKGFR